MSNYAKYKDIGEEKISSEYDDKKYLNQSKNSRNNYVQYKNLEDEKSMQINQSTMQGIPENHIAYNLKNDI
jgi:hypothetical protein